MDQLSCEFKAMTFDVKTNVKEFTIAGEVQQIKRVQPAQPEKAFSMLTALSQKYRSTFAIQAVHGSEVPTKTPMVYYDNTSHVEKT